MRMNILLAGVGGQGIVSLGHVILQSAMKAGLGAKGAETHGLSQRGGSVVFHARVGDFLGPLIAKGQADALLSLEVAETIRYLDFLRKDGIAIMSTRTISPNILIQIGKKYPQLEEIYQEVSAKASNVYVVPTEPMALKIGAPKAENLILLGVLLKVRPFVDYEIVEEVIAQRWPRAKEANLQALKAGYEYPDDSQGKDLAEILSEKASSP